MTESQRLQIRMSETRDAANDETTTDSDRTRLLSELRDLEVQFRTALQSENSELANAVFDGETTEFRELLNGASVDTIIRAAVQGHAVTGQEAELQQHYGLKSNAVPLRMLMPGKPCRGIFRRQRCGARFKSRNSRTSLWRWGRRFPQRAVRGRTGWNPDSPGHHHRGSGQRSDASEGR